MDNNAQIHVPPESDSALAVDDGENDANANANLTFNFIGLPVEMATRVLGFLPGHAILQCAQVSRNMNRLAVETALEVHFSILRPADRCKIRLNHPESPTPDALNFLTISCHIRTYSFLEFHVSGRHPDRELARIRRLAKWAKAIPRFKLTMGVSAFQVIDPRYRGSFKWGGENDVLAAFGSCMDAVVVKCSALYLYAWSELPLAGITFDDDDDDMESDSETEFEAQTDAPEDFATRFPSVAHDDASRYTFDKLTYLEPSMIQSRIPSRNRRTWYPSLKSVVFNPKTPLNTGDITFLDISTHFLRPPFSKWFFPLIQQTSPQLTLSFAMPLPDEENQFILQRLASAPNPSNHLFVGAHAQHSLAGILVGLSKHFGETVTELKLHAYPPSTREETIQGLDLAFPKLESLHVMPWIIEKLLNPRKNTVVLPVLKSVTLVSYAGNDLCDPFDPYTFARALAKLHRTCASADDIAAGDSMAVDSEDESDSEQDDTDPENDGDSEEGTNSEDDSDSEDDANSENEAASKGDTDSKADNSKIEGDSKADDCKIEGVSKDNDSKNANADPKTAESKTGVDSTKAGADPPSSSAKRLPLQLLAIDAHIDICSNHAHQICAGLHHTIDTGSLPPKLSKSEELVSALKSVKTLELIVPSPTPSDWCRSVQQGLHKDAILAFATIFLGLE